MLEPYATEFRRYRSIAEKALAQVSDEGLNRVPHPDGNSLAMLVHHLSGNLESRFTDFLTTDGEKPWRDRDGEFAERSFDRAEVDTMWAEGWAVLEGTLADLTEEDRHSTVRIRGQALTVEAALGRSLAHVAYHVGQMVLLARVEQGSGWDWISIPKGGSEAYNRNPTKERGLK